MITTVCFVACAVLFFGLGAAVGSVLAPMGGRETSESALQPSEAVAPAEAAKPAEPQERPNDVVVAGPRQRTRKELERLADWEAQRHGFKNFEHLCFVAEIEAKRKAEEDEKVRRMQEACWQADIELQKCVAEFKLRRAGIADEVANAP